MSTVVSTPTEEEIKAILEHSRTIAVVGWSDNEERPSNEVADYLHRRGYDVALANPRLAGTEGPWAEKIYASVIEIPRPIDIVDVFRRSEATPMRAAQAVAAKAGVFWLQLGIVNDEAGAIAEAAGLVFVQDRCLKTDHLRLIRGLG